MPRCQHEVTTGNTTRKCKINVCNDSKFCWRHQKTNLVLPPIPDDDDDSNIKKKVPAFQNKDTKFFESAIELIIHSIEELKISMNATLETKKNKKTYTRKDNLVIAMRLFYHDSKKDVAFLKYIAENHNLDAKSLPWPLVKRKSDEFWMSLDQAFKDKYIEKAKQLL